MVKLLCGITLFSRIVICCRAWWNDQHSVSVDIDELGRHNLIYAVAGSQLYINTSIIDMLPKLGVSPCNVLYIDARGDTGRQIDEFARSSKWHSSRHLAVVLNAEEVGESELRRLNFLLHFPDADVSGFANTVAVLAWNTLEDKGPPDSPHEAITAMKRHLAHHLNSDSSKVNGIALVGRMRRFSLQSGEAPAVFFDNRCESNILSCQKSVAVSASTSPLRLVFYGVLFLESDRF